MPTFKLRLGEEVADVEVVQKGAVLTVTRDGKTTELRLLQRDGSLVVLEEIRPDGARRRLRAAVHADGDQRQLWVNGRYLTYQRVRRQTGAAAAASGSLSASIPAVVSDILVAIGDQVEAGAKLILLESMKMVIPIQAPYAGEVTAVHCAPGESVQAGVPLLALAEIKE